jgi:predicted amidophosphoribosyltransferase
MEPICPQCHTPVRATDFFCFNCGKNLKPAPLSLSFEKLFMYYLGAITLPPMGIIWGIKYLKQTNQNAKIHGAILIIGTIIELIVLTVWTVQFANTIQKQVGSQLNNVQGF